MGEKILNNHKKAFTLIEVLLMVSILVILAVVVAVINPMQQIGLAQNAERSSHVNTILDTIHQYVIDNDGSIPDTISEGVHCEEEINRICKTDSVCAGLVDLSVLTTNEIYIASIPHNPSLKDENYAGYNVVKNSNGEITVCAPDTYKDVKISVTR